MASDKFIPKIGDMNRIDNTPGRTMRGAIAGLMSDSGMVRIASGYFRLSGLVQLEDDLKDFFARSPENKIQLLLSNQYDQANAETRKVLDIAENPNEYQSEFFLLDNEFYRDIVKWVQTGRIEVKIFVDSKFRQTHSKDDIAFLHGKAYLFSASESSRNGDVLIGSSNFTYGGLVKNRELNIYSQDTFSPIKSWFEEMWNEYSEDYSENLLRQFEKQKKEHSKPKVAYTPIKYLYWNLGKYYGKKTPETLDMRIRGIEASLPYAKHKDGHKYFAHQFIGIRHIYQQLQKFDTQVLADGVGLGKTLEATSIIKLYQQDLATQNDHRRVLILAGKRLRDQWEEELRNAGVSRDKVDITTRQAFTNWPAEDLQRAAGMYALIVIDEAHEGFLRKSNKAYENIQQIIHIARNVQGRTIRGLLLTATPWNNSREDVIRLGLLFLNVLNVPRDRQYYNYLITNREKLLYDTNDSGKYNHQAYIEFWKDLFYQRTRTSLANEKYLSDRYPTRQFPLENGKTPFVLKYSPDVSQALKDTLERLISLKLPYQDTVWQYFGPDVTSNINMRQRFTLLRMVDSSNAAFSNSLKNIKKKLENFKADISELKKGGLKEAKQYFINKVDSDFKLADTDEDMSLDLFDDDDDHRFDSLSSAQQNRINYINQELTENTLDDYLSRMLNDTIFDIRSMEEILSQWEIVAAKDEKEKIILKKIKEIVSKGGKVLIFSEFAKTVESYFSGCLADPDILKAGVGMVEGSRSMINHDECSKEEALGRFSPQSKSYLLDGKSEISVLIGTDAISTGQNLQDANYLITIELPYNPMRLEQRIGRIDRPKLNGDNNIYIYAFPSEEVINAELRLAERYEKKATNAKEDTEGDFKLPFIDNGEYKGLVSGSSLLEDAKQNKETIVASVQEDEACGRAYEFYAKIGKEYTLSKEILCYPYSFGKNCESIIMCQTDLIDVNQKEIKVTNPDLWDMTTCERIPFVKAENIVHKMLDLDTDLAEDEAKHLLKNVQCIEKNVLQYEIQDYNSNLKQVTDLESQPSNIAKIRETLKTGMKEYRNNFREQQVNGKQFNKIVDSLSNRGFSKEQKQYLQLLTDSDGKISSRRVQENVWNNLNRFVELFEREMLASESVGNDYARKANAECSKLKVIAGLISNNLE
ncbi:DNA helicase [Lactobacillus equicursoris]|uniref:DNA helicase n=1 Tax=Lactobacillus equicursoris TaxID=420645 RepID=A0A844FLT8_9LACO|nr:helicase-related protein [Lactobacillus equicursoris]MST79253.1 DNA helicase [Lactobacillus equicursoris]